MGELTVPGGTQMQEVRKRKPRGNSRVHKLPGMLPGASSRFRGGKEVSSWRPSYHDDIKLIHEHLGIGLDLGPQTAAQHQIWPAAYDRTSRKLKTDFIFLSGVLKKIKRRLCKG